MDSKYLTGYHFTQQLSGYKWALRSIWSKNILRLAPPTPFPTALTCTISNPQKIFFHPDDIRNFQSEGTFFQNIDAPITIGKGSYIAKNVGIITTNHDLTNLKNHIEGREVIIGEDCWIGMGAIILPGVTLANGTVVGAGSVVTKSILTKNTVIAGNPAKIIKYK